MAEEKVDVPRVTFNVSAEHREFLEKLPKGIRSKVISCVVQLLIDKAGDKDLFILVGDLFNERLVLVDKEKKNDTRGTDTDDPFRVG